MKFSLNISKWRSYVQRRFSSRLFGGRVRTSTLVLIMALVAVAWVFNTYRSHEPAHAVPPAPPGYVPDPNLTYVEKGRVDQPRSTVTVTVTPTTTSTTPPTTPPSTQPVTTTNPPPFVLPTLPCIPPFCTPSTSPTTAPSQQPQPGPGPVPTSAPPAS